MAWLGVQSSSLGGVEASATQEPQPEPEVAREPTPETTPQASPATSPVLEVFDEEDGVADADYAADMTATQSTWDPWPVTA